MFRTWVVDLLLSWLAATGAGAAPGSVPQPTAPHIFGSIAVELFQSPYAERWRRVERQTLSPQLFALIRPARAHTRAGQVQFVNALFNSRIGYAFDAVPTGDAWATADETLSKGSGDCEDVVIAKMQALRALGVDAADLYMTIGREGPETIHALLLVRDGPRLWVLDNRSSQPTSQTDHATFEPVVTFSRGRTWIHGYRQGNRFSGNPAYTMGSASRAGTGVSSAR